MNTDTRLLHTAPDADGVIWHQGLDPITDLQPAWRASRTEPDDSGTIALIRVGDRHSFAGDGFTWEVAHDVFAWSGEAPTLEAAMDEATDRLVNAYREMILGGY